MPTRARHACQQGGGGGNRSHPYWSQPGCSPPRTCTPHLPPRAHSTTSLLPGPLQPPHCLNLQYSMSASPDLWCGPCTPAPPPQEREKLGKAAAGAEEEDAAAPGPGSNIFAQQQQVSFATPRGRAVYNALFRKPPNRRHLIREMFLPRRTAFVYDFDPDTGGGDVPTTLRRSKADCPPVQVSIIGVDGCGGREDDGGGGNPVL
jgi:hypothetical protein